MPSERHIRFRCGDQELTFIGSIEDLRKQYPDAYILKIKYKTVEVKNPKWTDIPDYEGYYQMNRQFLVRGLDRHIKIRGKEIFIQGKKIEPINGFYTLQKEGSIRRFRIIDLYKKVFYKNGDKA